MTLPIDRRARGGWTFEARVQDPYQTLGVSQGAGADEIKSAYRRLAKHYHPDTAGSDPKVAERFHAVRAAYEHLQRNENGTAHSSSDTRRPNENTGRPASPKKPSRSSSKTQPGSETGSSSGSAFSDSLSGLAGKASGAVGDLGRSFFRTRGGDVTMDLEVTFMEACIGGSREIRLPTGRKVDVHIPAGVQEGQQIRLKGQGDSGFSGGDAGDAYLIAHLTPHDYFRREGLDIFTDVPISLTEAVQGAKISIPTIHGAVSIVVPANSNSGNKLRLKGKGIAKRFSATSASESSTGQNQGESHLWAGDHFVTLMVKLPDAEDPSLRRFVAGWRAGRAHNPRKT
ncbi:MAG: DnaJ domain-containing protein [Parvibaculaceae bacterium]|nr:DnaJ domain-containing protein [Parvibaculaceae bacterium]